MQPDTTPGLTQESPGAPDVGHETAFFLVEKHGSSLGDEPCSTLGLHHARAELTYGTVWMR